MNTEKPPCLRDVSFDPFFQGADVVDIKTIEGETDLRSFIAAMLSYYPWWIVQLYRVRELLVSILGLLRHEKPEELPCLAPEDVSFAPGTSVTFFRVVYAEEEKCWVAETPEDKHLKAYLGVVSEKTSEHRVRFTVFTTVYYLHWTGPVYFSLIRPFHHLVVGCMMRAAASHSSD